MDWHVDTEETRAHMIQVLAGMPPGFTVSVEPEQAHPSTKKQQASRNLWCRQVAECLNEKGIEKREVIDKLTTRGLDMLWTGDSFKTDVYKPIFQKVTAVESTQAGNTTDDNVVYMGICLIA